MDAKELADLKGALEQEARELSEKLLARWPGITRLSLVVEPGSGGTVTVDRVNPGKPAYGTGPDLMVDAIKVAPGDDDHIPVGSIGTFLASRVPDNWNELDSRVLSRDDYPELYEVIGEQYGTGDEGGTFRLPGVKWTYARDS